MSCARLEQVIDATRFRTPLRLGLQMCLAPFITGSIGKSLNRGGGPPACALNLRAGSEDKRGVLRRRLRNDKKVLRQSSNDIAKLQQAQVQIHSELGRLQNVSDHFNRLAKEQETGLRAREKQIEEVLNRRIREESETMERIADMQRHMSTNDPDLEGVPTGSPWRKHTFTQPSDEATYAALGVRPSRASGPALEKEVLRIRMENELELERLREQNRRLRELMAANADRLGLEETSPSVMPRTNARGLPVSPQHLISAVPHPSMRSMPDLHRSMYGAHAKEVRSPAPTPSMVRRSASKERSPTAGEQLSAMPSLLPSAGGSALLPSAGGSLAEVLPGDAIGTPRQVAPVAPASPGLQPQTLRFPAQGSIRAQPQRISPMPTQTY